MKKFLTVCMSILAFCGLFSGCVSQSEQSEVSDDQKISIVTTIFPEYDWVREIMGDEAENAEITMLLDNGIDLHNYQPTADDIIKISNCDMFIYVGGESDKWVEDALAEATNKDMIVVNLMDGYFSRDGEIRHNNQGLLRAPHPTFCSDRSVLDDSDFLSFGLAGLCLLKISFTA